MYLGIDSDGGGRGDNQVCRFTPNVRALLIDVLQWEEGRVYICTLAVSSSVIQEGG